jgi:hypothetical protein
MTITNPEVLDPSEVIKSERFSTNPAGDWRWAHNEIALWLADRENGPSLGRWSDYLPAAEELLDRLRNNGFRVLPERMVDVRLIDHWKRSA